MKGIIFDFNGTLYLDHDINYRAWQLTIDEITEKKYDFVKLYNEVGKGVPNNQFISYVLDLCGKENTKEIRDFYSRQKEERYQRIGIEENRTHLIAGAEDFLNECLTNHIPLNMASASIDFNVNFYFQYFELEKWFSRHLVAYDDGTSKDKVEMYRLAAERIGCQLKDCLVFEDSPKSITDAVEAGCQAIVFVNTGHLDFSCPQIIRETEDYRGINIAVFEQ